MNSDRDCTFQPRLESLEDRRLLTGLVIYRLLVPPKFTPPAGLLLGSDAGLRRGDAHAGAGAYPRQPGRCGDAQRFIVCRSISLGLSDSPGKVNVPGFDTGLVNAGLRTRCSAAFGAAGLPIFAPFQPVTTPPLLSTGFTLPARHRHRQPVSDSIRRPGAASVDRAIRSGYPSRSLSGMSFTGRAPGWSRSNGRPARAADRSRSRCESKRCPPRPRGFTLAARRRTAPPRAENRRPGGKPCLAFVRRVRHGRRTTRPELPEPEPERDTPERPRGCRRLWANRAALAAERSGSR